MPSFGQSEQLWISRDDSIGTTRIRNPDEPRPQCAVFWSRMAEQSRKDIAERLLRERLGLDEDWLNRDEDGTSHLPSALPRFITQRLSRPTLKALEADLDQLVAAGCRRKALYFCLAQLDPDADWTRTQLVGTREGLEAVANKAKAARKLILRYRTELLLAASVNPRKLPGGMFTTLPDPDEALSVLTDSLSWVCSLAESFATPFETTLLKSKGLLYLTLYVSMCADARHRRAADSRGKSGAPRHAERSKPRSPEHALASVARLTTGKRWSPSDLRGKLKRFQQDHPKLCATMKSKLAQLDAHSAQ